jgi:hypothetical protein
MSILPLHKRPAWQAPKVSGKVRMPFCTVAAVPAIRLDQPL